MESRGETRIGIGANPCLKADGSYFGSTLARLAVNALTFPIRVLRANPQPKVMGFQRLVQSNLDGLRQPFNAQYQPARACDRFLRRRFKENKSLTTAVGFAQGRLQLDRVGGKLLLELFA